MSLSFQAALQTSTVCVSKKIWEQNKTMYINICCNMYRIQNQASDWKTGESLLLLQGSVMPVCSWFEHKGDVRKTLGYNTGKG